MQNGLVGLGTSKYKLLQIGGRLGGCLGNSVMPVRSNIRRARIVTVCLLACGLSGCLSSRGGFSSKWAMDHERYAEKYDQPYGPNQAKNLKRMAKQSVDARFLKGDSGLYVTGGAASGHPFAVGGELGVFSLPSPTTTVRAGLVGLGAEGRPGFLTGGVFGVQLHSPSRLAPYVGLSGFAGYSNFDAPAAHDGFDNDNDGRIDERNEMAKQSSGTAAIVPEVGVQYWINGHRRVSIGASYYLTTDGRNEDFVLFGITFGSTGSARDSDPGPSVSEPTAELKDILESDAYFRTEEAAREADRSMRIYDGRTSEPPMVDPAFTEQPATPESGL